ncbi:MAG: hypothetical protein U0610_04450 [bacterium]
MAWSIRFGQIEPKVLITADAYPYGGKSHDCLDRARGWCARSDRSNACR